MYKRQAKAAREADGSNESTPDSKTESTGQNTEDLEAKLAGMDPEKAAKVRAAMEAKAKREAALSLIHILAKFKVPTYFEIVDDFPRTCSLKIEKKLLK